MHIHTVIATSVPALGISVLEYLISPLEYTGMTGRGSLQLHMFTPSSRSEGPALLHNHEGCVSGCSFSSDGMIY